MRAEGCALPWLRKRWARAFCAFFSLRRAGVSPNRWVLAPAPGKGEAMKWKSSILSSPRRPAVSKAPAVTCATQTIHNVQHSDELVKRYDATLHLCSTLLGPRTSLALQVFSGHAWIPTLAWKVLLLLLSVFSQGGRPQCSSMSSGTPSVTPSVSAQASFCPDGVPESSVPAQQ